MSRLARSFTIPSPLPILPLPTDQILFPSLVISCEIKSKASVKLIRSVLRDAEDQPGSKALIIGCVPRLPLSGDGVEGPEEDSASAEQQEESAFKSLAVPTEDGSAASPDDLYDFGTAARIVRLERTSAGGFHAVVEGLSRIKIVSYTLTGSPFLEAVVKPVETVGLEATEGALVNSLKSTVAKVLATLATAASGAVSPLIMRRLRTLTNSISISTAPTLIDVLLASIPSALGIPFRAKLDALGELDGRDRVEKAIEVLSSLDENMIVSKQIVDKVDANMSRKQREFILLQQLAAIKQELDELSAKDGAAGKGARNLGGKGPLGKRGRLEDDEEDEMRELEELVEKKQWTAEARTIAVRELKRLKKTPPQGAEWGVIRQYLDWLVALPWTEATPLPLDRDFIRIAREKLDEDHYGLDKIKKRLLEYLAVLRLKQEQWALEAKETAAIEAADSTPPPKPSSKSTAVVLRDPNMPAPAPALTDAPSAELPSAPATKKPAPRDKGPILLLVGPPGIGKTSLALSLAQAMGRKFYRVSLGGVRDEAEIRGHRRTYVGAMPGLIIQAIRKSGVNNPVILLDEVDKLGASAHHGDPGAALLEVLDPEQNWSFADHYLGTPFDLSSVLFIATANSLETISAPLLDRMETIELGGYVHDEKLHIARKYLLPKQLKTNMLPPSLMSISDPVLLHLITSYTRESGVRSLEREIGSVCRAKAVEFAEARDRAEAEGQARDKVDVLQWGYEKVVQEEDLRRILGLEKFEQEELDRESMPGIATGLAYSGSGNGGILHIEVTTFPGKGDIRLTGQLGEVISESASLAYTWVKSHAFELGISSSPSDNPFRHSDVHIHLPAGSIKKDGPSAGVAMVVAIVSCFRKLSVRAGTAMTGEITLRGNVTPVGGIKEKVLGAHRAGIRTVLLPYKNEKDVISDLPAQVREEVRFVYLRGIWDALEVAFGAELWLGPGGEKLGGRIKEARL